MSLAFEHERRFGAADYDARYVSGQIARYEAGVYTARERWLADYLNEVAAEDALDAGCGIGWFTRELLRRVPRVVGVDFSRPALRSAHGLAAGARLVCAPLEALPLRAASFDLVVACDVVEHVYEPERVLAELRRVARAGARLVLQTDNAASPSRWKGCKRLAERVRRSAPLAAQLEHIRRENGAPSLHVALYTAREVERMLAATGWRMRRLDTFPRLAPPWLERLLRSRPARLLAARHRGGALIAAAEAR